jgi:hypothetical protein
LTPDTTTLPKNGLEWQASAATFRSTLGGLSELPAILSLAIKNRVESLIFLEAALPPSFRQIVIFVLSNLDGPLEYESNGRGPNVFRRKSTYPR